MSEIEPILRIVGQHFEACFPYEQGKVALIRTIPGRRFLPKAKKWTFPVTPASCRALVNVIPDLGLQITPAVWRKLEEFEADAEDGVTESRATSGELSGEAAIFSALMPYQRAGVTYCLRRSGGVLIADEQGLGKSLQSLAVVETENAYPCLVVCPANVKIKWTRDECKVWLPHRTAYCIEGKGEARKLSLENSAPADFVVVNYELISEARRIVQRSKRGAPRTVTVFPILQGMESWGLRSIVIDEIQYLRHKNTKRTAALLSFAPKIPRRLGLSGTPATKPIELVSPLRILGEFNRVFGTFTSYADRFCAPKPIPPFGIDYSGAANLDQLNELLRANCMVRRLKKDVLPELPDKRRTPIRIELDPEIRSRYDKALNNLEEYIKETSGARAVARMKRAQSVVWIETLKRLAGEGKLRRAISWIEDYLDGGNKLVVFCIHRAIACEIATHFEGRAELLIGNISPKKRQQTIDLFQEPQSKLRLIVCNIDAVGHGLDFTAASAATFVELSWTPDKQEQAEDRIHRIGQSQKVMIYYLLADNTIDTAILELLEHKAETAKYAITGGVSGDKALLSYVAMAEEK